ncbi:hypothetical protein BT67DRAFT_417329 [Trichocladium antarcticum]|uniref:SPRY domain-containing protein n=1 Tax=Trichocladium antarcticum TaxID=1450529 RepID=A0AAN6UQ79_9PEZI|nr:hypothetical protein BT67DRAFT_417329 [Trichocladium antarcticum]
MCFGSSKNNANEDDAPRPASGRPSYAQESKASVPAQYQQQSHSHHQRPPSTRNDYAPPSGPPPSQRPPVSSAGYDDFAPPSGPPPSQRPPVSSVDDDFGPPPGPPPSHRAGDNFALPPGPPSSQRPPATDDWAAPPPGPPPSHRPQMTSPDDDFAPPPGPPPSQRAAATNAWDAPPPGPPPSHHQAQIDQSYMAPPPGPPPAAKPKHDWEAIVPDTSLFPPPPSFFSGFDRSPASNSTEAEAEAGERWCAAHPLTAPVTLDPPSTAAHRAHHPRLMQPADFRGSLVCTAPGIWSGNTDNEAYDSTIIAYPPLYAVTLDSPLSPTTPRGQKTVYYEVALARGTPWPADGICLALGYTALPYPSFRMPGWHRGSLAVHGDDGHRFVNDRWGGKSFTAPFRPGERLGVGMTFTRAGAEDGRARIETDVFFTRDGREVGRWNLHEETDAEEDLPVTGLEGYHDLSCAVGTHGKVVFEVVLEPGKWMYKPVGY